MKQVMIIELPPELCGVTAALDMNEYYEELFAKILKRQDILDKIKINTIFTDFFNSKKEVE